MRVGISPSVEFMFAHFRPIRFFGALLAALALVLTACGDDDGGAAGGGIMSDQEFCDFVAETEELPEEDGLESIAMFAEVARRAPNQELRDALGKFAEIAEELEGLDEDDPESIGVAFGLMFDPEVMEASETVERYMVETCGVDPNEFGGDFDDPDFEFDFDDDLDE